MKSLKTLAMVTVLGLALAMNENERTANSIAVGLVVEGDISVAIAASVGNCCPIELILQLGGPSAIRIDRDAGRTLAILLELDAMLFGVIVVYTDAPANFENGASLYDVAKILVDGDFADNEMLNAIVDKVEQ